MHPSSKVVVAFPQHAQELGAGAVAPPPVASPANESVIDWILNRPYLGWFAPIVMALVGAFYWLYQAAAASSIFRIFDIIERNMGLAVVTAFAGVIATCIAHRKLFGDAASASELEKKQSGFERTLVLFFLLPACAVAAYGACHVASIWNYHIGVVSAAAALGFFFMGTTGFVTQSIMADMLQHKPRRFVVLQGAAKPRRNAA